MQTDLFPSQFGFLIFMVQHSALHYKVKGSCNVFSISVSFYKVNSLNFWQIDCSFVSVTLICKTDSEQFSLAFFLSLFKEVDKIKYNLLRSFLIVHIVQNTNVVFCVYNVTFLQ